MGAVLAAEAPNKVTVMMHELASWLVHVAEGSTRYLSEVPTVATVLQDE